MADGSEFDWDNPEMAANPYEGREPRFYATILYNGCQWKGETLYILMRVVRMVLAWEEVSLPVQYMRKLMKEAIQPKGTSFYWSGEFILCVMQVLLICAEAMAMQDKLPEALDALNQVRRRAGLLKDLTAATQNRIHEIISP